MLASRPMPLPSLLQAKPKRVLRRLPTPPMGASLACAVLALCGAMPSPSEAATPDEVLLLVNTASQTSIAVAEDYAAKRQIQNVVEVQCIDSAASQDNETIDYESYLAEIETPIRAFLRSHPKVNFIVVTRGVPIRVAGGKTGEAFSGTPLASLDGTLAALDYDKIPGAVKITFDDPGGFAIGTAWLNRYWNTSVPFEHRKFGGYLVTRLDAYTLQEAQALSTRALQAEEKLTDGKILLDIEPDFGIDDPASQPAPITTTLITAESPFSTWNADMVHAAMDLKARGIPVAARRSEVFEGDRRNLLGYYSWGSNDDRFDQAAYNSLFFAPGAVGDTAVSTSARSFYPQIGGQTMIADLIAQGITGVQGFTDEPLLQGISSPTIVLGHFTRGYTLAESFYAGSHFVGWTDIVIGDPLAHPYKHDERQARE